MAKEPRFSSASSKRIRADLLRSEMKGHATGDNVRQVSSDYRRLVDPGAMWIVDGKEVTGFAYDAVDTAKTEFLQLARECGLVTLVAILPHGLPRMGAMAVGLALRAANSPLVLTIVDTDADAMAFIAKR